MRKRNPDVSDRQVEKQSLWTSEHRAKKDNESAHVQRSQKQLPHECYSRSIILHYRRFHAANLANSRHIPSMLLEAVNDSCFVINETYINMAEEHHI